MIFDANGGNREADTAGQDAFAERRTAESGEKSDPQDRQHEKLGCAEEQNERPHDRDRDSQNERAFKPGHEGAHQGSPQSPSRLPVLGHGVAVQNRGRRGSLARYAEQDGGDVSRGPGDGVHSEKEAERRDGFLDRIGEGEHQGQGGQASQARQNAHDKPDSSPQQKKTESGPGQYLEQTTDGGLNHGTLSG